MKAPPGAAAATDGPGDAEDQEPGCAAGDAVPEAASYGAYGARQL
jgi:hypothetical protein